MREFAEDAWGGGRGGYAERVLDEGGYDGCGIPRRSVPIPLILLEQLTARPPNILHKTPHPFAFEPWRRPGMIDLGARLV